MESSKGRCKISLKYLLPKECSLHGFKSAWITFSLSNKEYMIVCITFSKLGYAAKQAHTFNMTANRPFYSCLLSDLAFEWQRG